MVRKHHRINHADGSCTVNGIAFTHRVTAKKWAHRSRSKLRGHRRTSRTQGLKLMFGDMEMIINEAWAQFIAGVGEKHRRKVENETQTAQKEQEAEKGNRSQQTDN